MQNSIEKFDVVEAPNHYYRCGMWCKDIIKVMTHNLTGYEAVCVGNIVKYVWRYRDKNGLEDVKKARKYLDELISHLEKQHNENAALSEITY